LSLEELRKAIDDLDGRILRLLAERLDVARRIGEEKRGRGDSFYDPVRERQVLDRLVREAGGRFPAEGLRAIYREIISASRALETNRPVDYLGAPASLAHQAARERFGDSARFAPASAAQRIFDRIDAGDVDYAVLSLEASSLESHLDRLDLFIHSRVRIFGEFHVSPRIALHARPGASTATVYGHPASLVRCSRWVERESGARRFIAVGAPDEAGERAASEGVAALGYAALASMHDLALVETDLEDEPRLSHRFLILSQKDGARTGRDKTSLVAVIPNRPGGLEKVAGTLAVHRVNLCWIEPKATAIGAWDHIFFLDLEGHSTDESVARALDALRDCTDFMRVLGSYPSERPPGRSFG
jgi:chorismate mutase / prephenate dehydratase